MMDGRIKAIKEMLKEIDALNKVNLKSHQAILNKKVLTMLTPYFRFLSCLIQSNLHPDSTGLSGTPLIRPPRLATGSDINYLWRAGDLP